MRQNYNSFKYWENLISENKTIRGHMLMEKLPTEKSLYFHSLIFCKESGLSNIWGYVPDASAMLGYIQYSFLQEAFYTWINSKTQSVTHIPSKTVEQIIKDGEKSNKITKLEADNMRKQISMINKCWDLPKNKIIVELKRFIREFNKTWYGDSSEFLYLKIFETPQELGEFVLQSSYMSTSKDEFKSKTSENIETWESICSNATKDKVNGQKFKDVLQKNLTEII